MVNRKVRFTLLLLIVSLLAATARTVVSQQYTTTTYLTQVTSTQLSTETATVVLTTTQATPRTIFSATVTIVPTHGVCGIYFQQAFNATAGDQVSGSLTTDSTVDFYLMTDTVFKAWSHQVVAGGTCTPSSTLLAQHSTTSYNFATSIPSTGLYQIVLNNLSHSTVNANLNATIATPGPVIVTTYSYSTLTQNNVQTVTESSVQTAEPTAGSSPSGNSTWLIAALIVLIAVVVVAIMARRKRGAAKPK